MRIRDRLFPEGTKMRGFLRTSAIIVKNFRIRNIKRAFQLVKEIGLKGTFDKIRGVTKQKETEIDNNEIYQEWIKLNEPTPEEIEEQRKVEFKIQPKIYGCILSFFR